MRVLVPVCWWWWWWGVSSQAPFLPHSQARFLLVLAKYRPDILLAIRQKMAPAPPPEQGRVRLHESLRFVVSCAPGENWLLSVCSYPHSTPPSTTGICPPCCLVQEGLGWTDAQRAELRPRWERYQEQATTIRAVLVRSLGQLQASMSTGIAAWGTAQTMPQNMASYTRVLDGAAEVDAWTRLEMMAWADLAAFFFSVGAGIVPAVQLAPPLEIMAGVEKPATSPTPHCVCSAGDDPVPGNVRHRQIPALRH